MKKIEKIGLTIPTVLTIVLLNINNVSAFDFDNEAAGKLVSGGLNSVSTFLLFLLPILWVLYNIEEAGRWFAAGEEARHRVSFFSKIKSSLWILLWAELAAAIIKLFTW